jgi:hypothetical protein
MDGSLEHSLLKLVINETMTAINEYNGMMEDREKVMGEEKGRENEMIMERLMEEIDRN